MNDLDGWLFRLSTALEWGMGGLLILAAGLEIIESFGQAIVHLSLATLLCLKTPTSAPTKFLVMIVAFVTILL